MWIFAHKFIFAVIWDNEVLYKWKNSKALWHENCFIISIISDKINFKLIHLAYDRVLSKFLNFHLKVSKEKSFDSIKSPCKYLRFTGHGFYST